MVDVTDGKEIGGVMVRDGEIRKSLRYKHAHLRCATFYVSLSISHTRTRALPRICSAVVGDLLLSTNEINMSA